MQTVTTSRTHEMSQHGYRGRVRTGCLTCRGRKVKCDEIRPICNNCTRLKRRCVYQPRKSQRNPASIPSPADIPLNESDHVSGSDRSPEIDSVSQPYPSPIFHEQDCVPAETFRLDDATTISWEAVRDPFLSPDSSIVDVTARLENALRRQNEMSITGDDAEFDAPSPSTLISRDIELTTTMDLLAVRQLPLQPSFSFFEEAVDCPSITPYDGANWRRTKLDMINLGMSNVAVASAIIAVSAFYKAQLYSLPVSKAVSLYRSSRSAYEKLLNDTTQDFDAVLAAAFLLCLFEFIHYETVPFLKEPSEVFLERLRTWVQHRLSHSELASRIIAWLRLLHVATLRGGGTGLLSDSVCRLLPNYQEGITNTKSPSNHHPDASTHLYDLISTPIFEFYFHLQMISGEITELTHYHRSRTTGADQEEVVQQMAHVKSRLHALWESRPATQHQTPEDLRSHLAPRIANPIIALIGLCTAAYHAEFIEIDRVLGDPVSELTGSKRAMRQVQEIIDGDWNAYDDQGKLNPGYLRPLFLYAIECMDRAENQWAVERLEQIKDPICRSDFFASFSRALSEAQLRKERRVTSKYFCMWYFGVPPPFI